jgi:putative iron-only hydrogenase system regulator
MEERRLGVIGVVIENPAAVQRELNDLISEASDLVVGRMGIPYRDRNLAVLALVVDGTNDEINSITGRLGSLPGISVRAALSKKSIGGGTHGG